MPFIYKISIVHEIPHTYSSKHNYNLSQQSVGASVGTGTVKSIWDRDFTKYTNRKENINDIEPMASVIFSWAGEGLKNILICISAQVDSVHEL